MAPKKKGKRSSNASDALVLIPRAVEDPTEVQSRRPNEIKKAVKTREELRKEIEVRVASAQFLQQKSEVPFKEKSEKGIECSRGNEKRGERRKYSQQNKKSIDRVQSYWNSLGLEMKKDLLRVSVGDLKSYYSKDGPTSDILEEALRFGQESKSWKFWMCCRYLEKFSNSESHIHHVLEKHLGISKPQAWPQSIDYVKETTYFNLDYFNLDELCASTVKCSDNMSELISWIFVGPSIGEELQSWINKKNEQFRQGLNIFQIVKKNFGDFAILEARGESKLSFDARIITRFVSGMPQGIAPLDYRLILIVLVKSYIKEHLEDLADKDAIKQSDAVGEALLAQLDLEKSINQKK